MTIKWLPEKKWFSIKRIINIVFFSLFIITFLIVSFMPINWILPISQYSITKNGTTSSENIGNNIPNVQFDFFATFSAKGSLSVNNPVTVKFTAKNVNITNFLTYYQGIAFKNCYFENRKETDGIAVLNFMDNGDQTFTAKGQVVWLIEGETYVIPKLVGYEINIPDDSLNRGNSILAISGVSDTLSLDFSEKTTRLSWQLGTFSILVLVSLFEGIFLKDNPQQKNHK
jgi:hypothetical protein